jgi:predicted nucleic acid-binding protein
MKWLADTNVISEPMRSRPNASVLKWIDTHEADVAISIVTLAELRHGALILSDRARRDRLEHWISALVLPRFAQKTFHLTLDVLLEFLALADRLGARGRPQSAPDLLIAATARMHNLAVVTRNVRGFANTGITVYNPWINETQTMEAP